MSEALIKVAVCLGGVWQIREKRVASEFVDEQEAERLAREVIVPDDVDGIVSVSVPGWKIFFRISLERFYGIGLTQITEAEQRDHAERLFNETASS
ncbi:hypothetical protein Pan216_54390 [Planctomycetes bacterium Pan216]|uniref:Uncharacterized protein n=1 Tax=Kolteria novifilia TaxID=2527975 RepID=A0A518BC50_9BACT|nr:hypothetical protein Pan216_54390 [Planctomycetes bacterium Pan216]